MTKRFVRKRAWMDNRGVSEVVGSILILLMTVVLFSAIILWVWGLPTPKAVSKIDIGSEFNPIDIHGNDPPTWDLVFINLTHKGGERLFGWTIRFYLIVNDTVEILKSRGISGQGASYGISGTNDDWNIGEVWSYKNYSLKYYQRIRISLVDKDTSTVLWQKNLWGYEGARPPIFIDKWADGNPSVNSTVRDPVEDNKTDIYTGKKIPFGIFAKVVDYDKDLRTNSIYVTFTFGPLKGSSYRLVDNGSAILCDRISGDSVFSLCKNEFWPASDWQRWSGGILLLNATDKDNHKTSTRLVLQVYNYGDKIYTNQTTEISGNATWAKPHEYAIYEEVEWVAYGQGYVITNTDTKGSPYYNRSVFYFNSTDKIQVKVLSNILDNAYKVNMFKLYDATTGSLLVPPSGLKFVHAGMVAGYHKFVLNFTANTIQGYNGNKGGCYLVYIELRDTDDDYFSVNSWFHVKKSSGAAASCPTIKLYKDSSYTQQSKFFNSWDYMYIEVTPINATDTSVKSLTVEIQDFWGNSQVRNGPISYVATCHTGGVGPVSGICTGGSPLKYRLRIDLLMADKDPWLMGNASYTLFLRIFTDTNEYYENLNANMYVYSSAIRMDIVSGMAEAKGQGTYSDKYFGFFYENMGGYWEGSTYAFRSGQTGQADTIGEIYSVSFADMDGDLDRDIIAALQGAGGSSYLTYYDNYNGRGSFSRTDLDATPSKQSLFCSVATGDVNGDGLLDIVAGTDDGKLYYYANDGRWNVTGTIATGIGIPTSATTNGGHGIAIVNLDGDRFGEVVIGTSTGLRVYQNQSNNYASWDLKYSDTTNTNVVSVAVGEVGYPTTSNIRNDIAVGYTTGKVAVYLNGDGFSFTRVNVDTTTRNTIAAVGIGNMDDTNTWAEIVAGSGRKILIYKTSSHGESGTWSHYSNDDDSSETTRPNAAGDIGGDIKSIQVGNIDGVIEDDVAVSTVNARIYWYKNLRDCSNWQRFIVDDINAWFGSTPVIYTISAGDMNMGG